MTAQYQRAMVLYAQERYADAERELRGYLSQEPQNANAYAMLGLCLSHLDRHTEASAEARRAIGQAPGLPFAHYALAFTLYRRNRCEEALRPIEEAIALEPGNADYWSLLAAVRLELRQWPSALEAAERGLSFDPEHVQCTNWRAMALVKLGRRAEAGRTIDAALRRSPEDAHTHANQGWTLLHEGKPKEAMLHFREALRLDPNQQWARAGIIEAMKARFFLYRWLLAYFLWMARLSRRAQWGILVGGYVGYQALYGYGQTHPEAWPFIRPVIIVYVVFVAMTWLGYPLFNLLLRLSRFGRLALTRAQTVEANLIGCMLAVAAGVALWGWWHHDLLMLAVALLLALLMLPATSVFRMPSGWPQVVMISVAALLGFITLSIAVLLLALPRMGPVQQEVFLPWIHTGLSALTWGILIVSFGGNWLQTVRVRR